jgi:hypothetical protein
VLALGGCASIHFGIVGIERRPGAETELVIVGPVADASRAQLPCDVDARAGTVDELTTTFAFDRRCHRSH